MISELVAGSAWIWPPVDGLAEAATGVVAAALRPEAVPPAPDEQAVLARRLGYEEYPRRAFLDDYLQITRRARRAMERIFHEELAG